MKVSFSQCPRICERAELVSDLLAGKVVRRPRLKMDDTLGGSQIASMISDCMTIAPEERKTVRQLKNYVSTVLKIKLALCQSLIRLVQLVRIGR